MYRKSAPANDRRVFARTAASTKRVNIMPGNFRGGIRL